jgi:hypothetical protein
MNPPSLQTRVVGTRIMAALLFVAYAVIVVGWCEGSLPWWLALSTVVAAIRTFSAIRTVRRYKAWVSEWERMGEPLNSATQPAKRPRRRWPLVSGAALLFLAIPVYLSQAQDDGGWVSNSDGFVTSLTLLWCGVGVFLIFRLIRGIMRRMTKRGEVRTEIAAANSEGAPVTWLVNAPSWAPTRRSAEKNLLDIVHGGEHRGER